MLVFFGALSVGVLVGVLLVVFSTMMPYNYSNWSQFTIPLPPLTSFKFTIFYTFLFMVLYVLILPFFEYQFYLVFHRKSWEGTEYYFIVIPAYAFMNLAVFVNITDPLHVQLLLTIVSTGIFSLMILLIKRKHFWDAMLWRFGLALGIAIWMIYEKFTTGTGGILQRQSPLMFFGYDYRNKVWAQPQDMQG